MRAPRRNRTFDARELVARSKSCKRVVAELAFLDCFHKSFHLQSIHAVLFSVIEDIPSVPEVIHGGVMMLKRTGSAGHNEIFAPLELARG